MNSVYNWYHKAEQLGEGSFGAVFKGWSRNTGRTVAMKEIPLIGPRASTITTVAHEVLALKTLRHRNIVHLHDAYYEETKIVLIFEYCHQDLRSFMNQYGYQGSGILDSATIRSFMKQLLSGVRFCHQHNFYHRDLKPSNLLIQYTDSKWILKIADFGFASSINLGEHRSFQVTTFWYRAPELLLHCTTYSTPIDIWAIGCTFAEMLCGAPLFYGPEPVDEHGQLKRIVSTHGSPSDAQLLNMRREHPEIVIWPDLVSHSRYSKVPWRLRLPMASKSATALLDRFLKFDPAERISASRAISDVYFEDAQQPQHYSRSIQHQASQSYSQRTFNPPAHHQPWPNLQNQVLSAPDNDTVAPVYSPYMLFPPAPIFASDRHRQHRRPVMVVPPSFPTFQYHPQDHRPEYTDAYEARRYGNVRPAHGVMAGYHNPHMFV